MVEINKIQRIKIENVKGKKEFELVFNELHANYPNLFIAPNGFGKSTIAKTFKSLKQSKIDLDKEDLFEANESNIPSLLIELNLSGTSSILVADTTKNEISPLIDTYVINNPVYAKSTARSFGSRFSSQSAKLDVEDLVLYDNLPPKVEIPYKVKDMKDAYGEKGKVFENISDVFKSLDNLELLSSNYELLNKCATQKRPENAINEFFEKMAESGTGKYIKDSITDENIKLLKANTLISELIEIIKNLENLPFDKENEIDLILTAIQIIEITKMLGSDIKKAKTYLEYLEYRSDLDYKLNTFNTTGRSVKSKETRGKLVVEFLAANKMSNGERDVLSFISNLSKFKVKFKKKIGILIIDEIFDYLDGSNMLIVQYYLSKMIEEYKAMGKVLFPIILTHLDPTVFNNYYFKRPKVHYLMNYSYIDDNTMLDLLKIRNDKDSYNELAKKIEAHYLHFKPDEIHLSDEEKSLINNEGYHGSALFYEMIHNEVDKFLKGEKYDPLKIICAIRVKIEKIVYNHLATNEQRTKYIEIKTTIKKLNYAVDQGLYVPEDFFLLQPLYNDALHLNDNENATRNKIQSICLKLDNFVVKRIVEGIQNTKESNLIIARVG